MKSGFVALIGRPNVGKSTLLNQIVGKKISIISNKPQTTRNRIQGIYHKEDLQIIFVDTPGIHKPNHKLGKYLNRQAYDSMEEVDLILFLVDVTKKIGKGDLSMLERLKQYEKPVFLLLNKIDQIPKLEILEKIDTYQTLYPFQEIVPISALKRDNVDTLLSLIEPYLKDEIAYYEKDQVTDRSTEFLLSELVREKVFQLTEEEVPHSTSCVIDQIKVGKSSTTIYATIVVDRESLKKIIVGAHGSMIKKIGTEARKEMEELLKTKVYLSLFVKTVKNWRDKEQYLSEFGYHESE